MSRQLLRSYQDIGASLKGASDKFIKDYSAVKDDLAAAIKNLAPLSGVGSPEGNIAANLSRTFFDTTASPVSVTMYFNETVGSKTGWVAVA